MRPSDDPYDVPVSPQKTKDARAPKPKPKPTENGTMSEPTPKKRDNVVINISDEESSSEAKAKPADVNGNSSKPDKTTEAAEDATKSTDADQPAEASTPVPADTNGAQAVSNTNVEEPLSPELKIEEICAHRVDKQAATVTFLVSLEGGDSSWEPEFTMQMRFPELVDSYWGKFASREAATSLVTYHVFRILQRKVVKRKVQLLVQWTGYTEEDATWESRTKIRTIAPDLLRAFEAERRAAGSQQPSAQAPSAQATSVQAPSVQAPSVEATSVQAPSVQATSVEATSVQAPSVQATSAQAAKRPADRGTGRPRKKARAADDE